MRSLRERVAVEVDSVCICGEAVGGFDEIIVRNTKSVAATELNSVAFGREATIVDTRDEVIWIFARFAPIVEFVFLVRGEFDVLVIGRIDRKNATRKRIFEFDTGFFDFGQWDHVGTSIRIFDCSDWRLGEDELIY